MPSQISQSLGSKRLLPYLILIWLLASVCLTWHIIAISYHAQVVADSQPPLIWPTDSGVVRATDRHTAVVFLNDKCGCSRASITELCRLNSHLEPHWKCIVILTSDTVSHSDIPTSHMYQSLRELRGIEIVIDKDSLETNRFNAGISGELLLYAPDGNLKFRGGVTPSRGHEGINVGALAINDWVKTGHSSHSECSIYGCRMLSVLEHDKH